VSKVEIFGNDSNKSKLHSGRNKEQIKFVNACCHSLQSLFSSHLFCRNLKIKIYRTIILSVVLYGFETWSDTKEDHRLRVFEKMC
jgi:hypothetical protein